MLFSQSGITAVIEETQLKATLLALAEINAAGGVDGREIVPHVYDPASDPASFAVCARRLLVDDDVTTIFGCYTSSSRKAVLPVVERLNGLLWYPTLYEGFEFSPNVIYTGAAPNQNSAALCSFLINTYGTRFYFVGSDYVYPRQSNRVMRQLVREAGGTVVGERYVDLRAGRADFLPVVREFKHSGADVIFSTVVGESTAFLYQCYAEAGIDPYRRPIASLTTSEAEMRAMGFDVAQGQITAASYFQSVATARNAAFVARYQRHYGEEEPTNMCAEAAYFQVHLFANALAVTRSVDTDAIKAAVLGSAFDAPQGRVSVNAATSHTDVWSRIGRANCRGQFDIVHESATPVWADPYLVGSGRIIVSA